MTPNALIPEAKALIFRTLGRMTSESNDEGGFETLELVTSETFISILHNPDTVLVVCMHQDPTYNTMSCSVGFYRLFPPILEIMNRCLTHYHLFLVVPPPPTILFFISFPGKKK